MGSVRTSILGRPRHLSRDRCASHAYTRNCDEPDKPRSYQGLVVNDDRDQYLASSNSRRRPPIAVGYSFDSASKYEVASISNEH
jgi:hypothetical protein